jgi:hypothetical protein
MALRGGGVVTRRLYAIELRRDVCADDYVAVVLADHDGVEEDRFGWGSREEVLRDALDAFPNAEVLDAVREVGQ